MKTFQMTNLIEAMTGRKLTLDCADAIPLDCKVGVYRAGCPKQGEHHCPHFVWKTPKDEDNIIRSFITAFCTKYKEPNPASYLDYNGKPNFEKYATTWNDETLRCDSPCWHHHVGHMLSSEQLRSQVEFNFAGFTSGQFSLCFYPTNYGVGLFTLMGGKWVIESLNAMARHLSGNSIPYRTELSRAHWVTRFVIGATKDMHAQILSTLNT